MKMAFLIPFNFGSIEFILIGHSSNSKIYAKTDFSNTLRDKGVIINDYDSTLGKYAKFFFANKTYLTQKYSGFWL